MAKINTVKEPLKQICFPTDIIMDYDPNGDAYWTHKLLMKEIAETFQKKYGVNFLRTNPHMKCYLIDENLEDIVPVKAKSLELRFQNAVAAPNLIDWGNIEIAAPVAPLPEQADRAQAEF